MDAVIHNKLDIKSLLDDLNYAIKSGSVSDHNAVIHIIEIVKLVLELPKD